MVVENRANRSSEASAEDDEETPLDDSTDRKWVDLRELARLVGVSYQTALRYKKDGRFQAIEVGGRWRVYKTELERFLREGNYKHPNW
jgi:excisionase family DNA binding protein